MLVGYARISTNTQSLELQQDALIKIGCEKIFEDCASGGKADRPGLVEALRYSRKGDTLVVWRLDRLGRSLQDLIMLVNGLNSQGIEFRSLQESMDTATSGGKLIFHLFGAIAEFERNLIIERTKAGIASARLRGRLGGRKQSHSDAKIRSAQMLVLQQFKTVAEVCEEFGFSEMTYYRRVKKFAKMLSEQSK